MKRQHQNLGHGSYSVSKNLIIKLKLALTKKRDDPMVGNVTQSRLIGLASSFASTGEALSSRAIVAAGKILSVRLACSQSRLFKQLLRHSAPPALGKS